MKRTDIVQPHAMPSIFGEDIYSASGTTNFEIPEATSSSATDTCVMDNGFLPITSEPLDDGGIAPERKNFNGLFYLSTDQRYYLQNGGFITYDANVATAIGGYPQGAVLGYLDSSNHYSNVVSLIDDNTYNFNQDPSYIDGVKWVFGNESGNDVIDILKIVYPVGSVFLSTTASCPLASLFGTWTLIGTSIITSVSSSGFTGSTTASVSVKGNGKALGLTDGSSNYGLQNGNSGVGIATSSYNASAGTNSVNASTVGKVIGVTTNASGSGLTGSVTIPSLSVSVSNTSLSVNIFKRTA